MLCFLRYRSAVSPFLISAGQCGAIRAPAGSTTALTAMLRLDAFDLCIMAGITRSP